MDLLGQALGVVVLLMTVIFTMAAADVAINASDFAKDLVPNLPDGAADLVMALVGSPSITVYFAHMPPPTRCARFTSLVV